MRSRRYWVLRMLREQLVVDAGRLVVPEDVQVCRVAVAQHRRHHDPDRATHTYVTSHDVSTQTKSGTGSVPNGKLR